MIFDHHMLNEKTMSDAYPLLNITDILNQFRGTQYFSLFDMKSDFHQIKMNLEDNYCPGKVRQYFLWTMWIRQNAV